MKEKMIENSKIQLYFSIVRFVSSMVFCRVYSLYALSSHDPQKKLAPLAEIFTQNISYVVLFVFFLSILLCRRYLSVVLISCFLTLLAHIMPGICLIGWCLADIPVMRGMILYN